jgi:hypothetical protein
MVPKRKASFDINYADLAASINKLITALETHTEELKNHKNTIETLTKSLEKLDSIIKNTSDFQSSSPSPKLKRVVIEFMETYINPRFYKIPGYTAIGSGFKIPRINLPVGQKSNDSLISNDNLSSVASKQKMGTKSEKDAIPHIPTPSSNSGDTKMTDPQTIYPQVDKLEETSEKGKVQGNDTDKKVPDKHPFLVELENNLSIARNPSSEKPASFNTEVWFSQRSDLTWLDFPLQEELRKIYGFMLLANNIAWLVTELGRNSQEVIDSYLSLQTKIAEGLERIVPSLITSLAPLASPCIKD